MRRTRAVVENMAEMRIGGLRAHFRSRHAGGVVRFFQNLALIDRTGETWPAGAGIEFVERTEQRTSGNHVDVNARAMIVPVGVAERRFGAALLRDVELIGVELL